jgi:hypothetical protein
MGKDLIMSHYIHIYGVAMHGVARMSRMLMDVA